MAQNSALCKKDSFKLHELDKTYMKLNFRASLFVNNGFMQFFDWITMKFNWLLWNTFGCIHGVRLDYRILNSIPTQVGPKSLKIDKFTPQMND